MQAQLKTIEDALASNPGSQVELLENKKEVEAQLAELDEALSALRAKLPPPPPKEEPKWDVTKHPKYQAESKNSNKSTSEASASIVYKTNDKVLARYSVDGKFYPAKITSITGSSVAPQYSVKYDGYNNMETLQGDSLRPVHNESKKRNAEPVPAAVAPTTRVISAAADIDANLATKARQNAGKVDDGPARPAKIQKTLRGKGGLEKGRNNWQSFMTKTGKAGKAANKESMFRTADNPKARGK